MNNQNIKKLKDVIKASLCSLINSDYVLLDVPNHGNIGDNLIWEGELSFLKKEIPYQCLYSANFLNCDESRIGKAGIILFHGGGNWGDLYRECQEFRNKIARKYRNKRIIVFPQTVWYNNESLVEQDCAIFNQHPDCYICLRDNESYNFLNKYLPAEKLLLLPDMAFYINVPKRQLGAKKLYMVRTDHEINRNAIQTIKGCDISDWPSFSNNRYINMLQVQLMVAMRNLSRKIQNLPILGKLVDHEYGFNRRNSRTIYINKGYEFLSQYNTIYTTRLHGMILGVLMGLDVIIVDNKYNKCSNFYNTWLSDFEKIKFYYE